MKTLPLKARRRPPAPRPPPEEFWQLRLYLVDQTPRSLTAFANLKQFCETHLKGRHRIKVIDLLKQPQLAIPTVVRQLPKPVRTVFGNLVNLEPMIVGLDLRREV